MEETKEVAVIYDVDHELNDLELDPEEGGAVPKNKDGKTVES